MRAVLTVLVIAFLSFSCGDKGWTEDGDVVASEISFIASEEELDIAIADSNLRGIAISVNFYNISSHETQFKIHDLVYRVVAFKNRPVFLYGQPFDRKLANMLLRVGDDVEDGSGCTPTAWAGIFPQEQDVGKMCGADDKPRSEENFRKWIIDFWDSSKNQFLKQ